MAGSPSILLDEASAPLPLFDGLPVGAVDRLAAGGFGRGLLTAALLALLRKGRLADMEALALASPTDLMAVRKVGPVRVGANRAHVLGEPARLVPGARTEHDQDVTDRRRLDRLRAVPAGPIPLGEASAERPGRGSATWADLDLLLRVDAARQLRILVADLGGIVAAPVRALQPDPPHALPAVGVREDDAVREGQAPSCC